MCTSSLHAPRACRGKIVDGRVAKIAKERALLEQPFIKDTSKSVAEHIKAAVAAIGENIQVRRRRWACGEHVIALSLTPASACRTMNIGGCPSGEEKSLQLFLAQ